MLPKAQASDRGHQLVAESKARPLDPGQQQLVLQRRCLVRGKVVSLPAEVVKREHGDEDEAPLVKPRKKVRWATTSLKPQLGVQIVLDEEESQEAAPELQQPLVKHEEHDEHEAQDYQPPEGKQGQARRARLTDDRALYNQLSY